MLNDLQTAVLSLLILISRALSQGNDHSFPLYFELCCAISEFCLMEAIKQKCMVPSMALHSMS